MNKIDCNAYNLPLEIMHKFPYKDGDSFDEKCKVISDTLKDLKERGFGGVCTNVPWGSNDEEKESFVLKNSGKGFYLDNQGAIEIYRFILSESEKLGLRVWFYDEKGYPSGSAGGYTLEQNPDGEARGAVILTKELEPNGEITVELPIGHECFLYGVVYNSDGGIEGIKDFTKVYDVNCFGKTEPITLKNTTDKKAVACAFIKKHLYEGTHAQHNVCESRRYIDVGNPEIIKTFVNNTYKKYYDIAPFSFGNKKIGELPKFGKLEASFTDEVSYMGCYINNTIFPESVHDKYDNDMPLYPLVNWPKGTELKFIKKYKYSLLENMIYLFTGKGDWAKKVRCDYYSLISELYENAFFKVIEKWCHKAGVNFSGHILLEDEMPFHVIFEGNYFSLMRHMDIPGIDMLHALPDWIYDRFIFTPKLISSVAKAYNKKHVMNEVSNHTQIALNMPVSIPQMYSSICLQYALGTDIFNYYFRANFMEKEEYLKRNLSHGRIDSLMQGKTVCDVMAYYNIETIQMHHLGSDEQLGAYQQEEKDCWNSTKQMCLNLTKAQMDYDFADYEYLSRCKVKNGKLIAPNGEYKVLILPAGEITEKLNKLLTNFASKGLKIMQHVCGEFKKLSFAKTFDSMDELTKNINRAEFEVPYASNEGRLALLLRDTGSGRRCMFVNADEKQKQVNIIIRGIKNPVLYSPLLDKELPLKAEKTENGTHLQFNIDAFDTLLVIE